MGSAPEPSAARVCPAKEGYGCGQDPGQDRRRVAAVRAACTVDGAVRGAAARSLSDPLRTDVPRGSLVDLWLRGEVATTASQFPATTRRGMTRSQRPTEESTSTYRLAANGDTPLHRTGSHIPLLRRWRTQSNQLERRPAANDSGTATAVTPSGGGGRYRDNAGSDRKSRTTINPAHWLNLPTCAPLAAPWSRCFLSPRPVGRYSCP